MLGGLAASAHQFLSGVGVGEAGDGLLFIVQRGDDFDEAHDFKNLAGVSGWMEHFEGAALLLHHGVTVEQAANAGAVELRNFGEVYENVFGALARQFVDTLLERVSVRPNHQAALQINDAHSG